MSAQKEVIDGWYATQDIDTYLDENIHFEVMEGFPGGGVHKGIDAVKALFASYPDRYSEFTFEPWEVIDGDSAVVGRGRYFGVIRANGAPFDVQVCHVWRVENGKITRLEHYVNTHVIQLALTADQR